MMENIWKLEIGKGKMMGKLEDIGQWKRKDDMRENRKILGSGKGKMI